MVTKTSKIEQKSRVKHGIYFWLKTGKINPSIRGYKKLQKYLEDIERDLIEAQGGPDQLTAAKEILIKGTIEAYGILLLASMYCKRAGILRPDKIKHGVVELQPVLGQQFLAFMNTMRQNLMALGIDSKKAGEITDLNAYLEEKAKEKRGSGK